MIGGRTRTRTLDPLIKSQLLYQLIYAPSEHCVTWGDPLRSGATEAPRVVALTPRRPGCPGRVANFRFLLPETAEFGWAECHSPIDMRIEYKSKPYHHCQH